MNVPIAHHVIAVIARCADIDAATISPEATLAGLGVAPCRAMDVTFAIEDAFDINVPLGTCDLGVDSVGVMIEAVRAAMHPAFAAHDRPVNSARPSPAEDESDRWWYAEIARPLHVYPPTR